MFVAAAQRLVHLNLKDARRTLVLRFDQFEHLLLQQPLSTTTTPDPAARMRYRLQFRRGAVRTGRTQGLVENALGLFLFEPTDNPDRFLRLFVPREAYGKVDTAADLSCRVDAARVRTDDGCIGSSAQLARVLAKPSAATPTLAEALVQIGSIAADEIVKLSRQYRSESCVSLDELLLRTGKVSPKDALRAMVEKMGVPLVDLRGFSADADALEKVPYPTACRFGVLPLMLHGGSLVVVLEDASRRSTLDALQQAVGLPIIPVLAIDERLARIQKDWYFSFSGRRWSDQSSIDSSPMPFAPTDPAELMETLRREMGGSALETEDPPIEQSDNSLVRLINQMIVEANAQKASDIHVESLPGRGQVRIRFRVDGALRTYLEVPHTYRGAMLARIKIMADLDISERRKPQDGKIDFARFVPGTPLELRVATIPTANGLEDAVLRILAAAKPTPMESLGLSADNLVRLKEAVSRPQGLLLCVGPTGSGKTTTLHSLLAQLNTPDRKIWTAEDPIEITQSGLRQVQVNPRIDWTFALALRAFLRADPDVVMIGEIRDHETAKIAVEAALTGHLVLSTLHTNGAPETVARLLDMGLNPFNFADALIGVLAQRLVKANCPHCQRARVASGEETAELLADYLGPLPAAEADAAQRRLLRDWEQQYGQGACLQLRRSAGCMACGQSRTHGRLGLHELMIVSPSLRRLIQEGASSERLRAAAQAEGMRSLRQDGIEKVLQGLTTLEQVHAATS
jgi:type II secretory ATPase GspE/PulE/Tfp pilus assembly ATPase PilB-like protein